MLSRRWGAASCVEEALRIAELHRNSEGCYEDEKVVWFSAFRHVVPADYENWLEKMAARAGRPAVSGSGVRCT